MTFLKEKKGKYFFLPGTFWSRVLSTFFVPYGSSPKVHFTHVYCVSRVESQIVLYLAKREATDRKTPAPDVRFTRKPNEKLPLRALVKLPTGIPQPIRGPYGDIRSGTTNEDRIRTIYFTPPSVTMVCSFLSSYLGFRRIPNLKWPFSLPHTRPLNGHWWLKSRADSPTSHACFSQALTLH